MTPTAKRWVPRYPAPGALAVLAAFLALIVALANGSQQPYVLFPELGALASVIVQRPAGAWARSPLLLCLTPFLTALVGVAITRGLDYGPVSVGLDVALSIAVVRLLRSPIAPALSAGMLPLALGVTAWSYPLSILVGTGLLALWSRLPLALRERLNATARPRPPMVEPAGEWARASTSERQHPWRWIPWMVVFLGLGILLITATGSRLVLYPPLVVMAYDMLSTPEECAWINRPVAMVLACLGTASAGLLTVQVLGVTPLAGGIAILACLGWLGSLGLFMPPAIGAGLLPFVIHAPGWDYPLAVVLGTALLAVVSRCALRTAAAKP